jgi:hypothetical protein
VRHGLGDDRQAVGQDVALDGACGFGHFVLGVGSILAHAGCARHRRSASRDWKRGGGYTPRCFGEHTVNKGLPGKECIKSAESIENTRVVGI